MPVLPGLAWTFDTAAADYDRYRPGYDAALFRMIFDAAAPGTGSRAVEIGIGSGQATLPFLQTGCSVLAVEQGAALSEICRRKFAGYPQFSVVTGRFEHLPFPDDTFDLVYSATAFHWIPEQAGYKKVFAMLRHGGIFARFANHPYPGRDNPALARALDRLYAEYYAPYYHRPHRSPAEFTEAQAADIANLAAKYGFCGIRYALFHRTRTFSAEEYCALLGTYSDHIAMDAPVREAFFAQIRQAIRAHGGTLTISDTMDLELAAKP